MSKFEDLCKSYKISRKKYFSYQNESYDFARNLVQGYIRYLDIPEEQFKFIPLDKEPKAGTNYTIFGAIHLAEDSFWNLGMQITLYSAPNEFPHQPVLIRFKFKKKSENVFVVKISDEDKEHSINIDSDNDFNDFYDYLQAQIQSHFEDGFQKFLEQTAPLRTIGFNQHMA